MLFILYIYIILWGYSDQTAVAVLDNYHVILRSQKSKYEFHGELLRYAYTLTRKHGKAERLE